MAERMVFFDRRHYGARAAQSYAFLPFRFARLDDSRVLLTNDTGEFCVLPADAFAAFAQKTLTPDSSWYADLRAKHFLADHDGSAHARVIASKLRTKKSFLDGFTKLHIFVVTLRCDHACPYCQVSRQSKDRFRYDMSEDTARRAVDLMLRSPASAITCEFQGGEALLNFELVKHIVRYAKERNQTLGKSLDFVICTNLSTLSDAHLTFFVEHDIKVSTSLDGPAPLHDKNRPFGRTSSHAVVTRNLRRAQEALGLANVSALMTTTRESLKYPREIVDEYLRHDLGSIFVRSLSPYGFAVKTAQAIGYSADDFIAFYKRVLAYIIELNRAGRTFAEAFATMVLRKILTPYPIGYVDLQSPAGPGFGVAVYNYDGDVYASDEARMLAEMNDPAFRLGNVFEDAYEDIFFGEQMQTIAAASCNEALTGCSDCAFQAYCGADPVYHYATHLDMFGNRATSGFCKRNMAIIRHLFELLLTDDADLQRIFWAWMNEAAVREMRLPEPPWLSG